MVKKQSQTVLQIQSCQHMDEWMKVITFPSNLMLTGSELQRVGAANSKFLRRLRIRVVVVMTASFLVLNMKIGYGLGPKSLNGVAHHT